MNFNTSGMTKVRATMIYRVKQIGPENHGTHVASGNIQGLTQRGFEHRTDDHSQDQRSRLKTDSPQGISNETKNR